MGIASKNLDLMKALRLVYFWENRRVPSFLLSNIGHNITVSMIRDAVFGPQSWICVGNPH